MANLTAALRHLHVERDRTASRLKHLNEAISVISGLNHGIGRRRSFPIRTKHAMSASGRR
jgi:hypothetical protein